MKLPEQRNIGVQSLGRHDTQAPMREANIKVQGHMQNQQIVNALADTAVDFEAEYTKQQVLQAGYEFDSDRRDNMSKWLGRDIYSKAELEKVGVTLPEDDTRINIPAYEVLPDIMKLVDRESLDRRAGKISNKKSRAAFLAGQTAAIDEENIKYQVSARTQMIDFHNKQAVIRADEQQQKRDFVGQRATINLSNLDENDKRTRVIESIRTEENVGYYDAIAESDLPGLQKALAFLTQDGEQYIAAGGSLTAPERASRAKEVNTKIAKINAGTATTSAFEKDAVQQRAKQVVQQAAERVYAPSEVTEAIKKEAIRVGDHETMSKVMSIERERDLVVPFLTKPFQDRERAIRGLHARRQAGKLTEEQAYDLHLLGKAHTGLVAATREDLAGEYNKIYGEMPADLSMKGQDGKPVPLGPVVASWGEYMQKAHMAMGTPGADSDLIPKSQVPELLSRLNNGTMDTKKKTIVEILSGLEKAESNGVEAATRRFWKQLEMSKDGAVYGIVGDLLSAGMGAEADGILLGMDNMENVDGKTLKTAEIMLQRSLGDTYFHDPERMTTITTAARYLAVTKAMEKGDFDDVVGQADEAVKSLFTGVEYNGVKFEAPRGMSPWKVKTQLNNMKPRQLVDLGLNPEYADKFIERLHDGDILPRPMGPGVISFVDSQNNWVTTVDGAVLRWDFSMGPIIEADLSRFGSSAPSTLAEANLEAGPL